MPENQPGRKTWNELLESRMTRKCQVRFGGGRTEKGSKGHLAGRLPYLFGYEVREYLLEKWGRKCAYCGAENVPLFVEHLTPRSRWGSNRLSNLALACFPCNDRKGNRTAEEFGYPEVQARAKEPLKDATAANVARQFILRGLRSLEIGRAHV